MNSTPAPLSTAAAARAIWSGTGEVNTSPGQAADSIPCPTNPPCSGSVPDPPPGTPPPPPGHRGVPSYDPPVLDVDGQLGMSGRHTPQRIRDHGLRDVDE